MKPPSPVSIPPNVDITMKRTDYLTFKFTGAGVFCSSDSDDFIPPLPHGEKFAAGDSWPDDEEYPKGAQPTGDNDSKYNYRTGADEDCDGSPIDTVTKVIRVGSTTG